MIAWARRGPFAAQGMAPMMPAALMLSTSTQKVQNMRVLFLTRDI